MVTIKFDLLGHNNEVDLTSRMLPHIWCSGCSLGTNVQSFIRGAISAGLNLDREVVMVSGIGCTGRASGYIEADGFHTTHGRAIAFATGVKLGNPNLEVVVFSGDGDLFAIGGNHFIHAARRKEDLTVICTNNSTYGLTGGQASPTTFENTYTPTTIEKNDKPFDLVNLALGAGAAFVARYTSAHYKILPRIIKEALQTKGMAFIDLISGCPAIYGKKNGYPTGEIMVQNFLESSVDIVPDDEGTYLLPENTAVHFDQGKGYTKIPVGIFRRGEKK
ncbi:MAG: thiamine pyrophosphate-dependent enzyme [Candidatus Heimdallarchaeota archaeon]|nr:thiamine pyrophosphate-dependent enzyme [Candidatus Heimdallarchaeota archaeon]MDH5645879.1 thiamine pyrophosphate-dependent enzyme [Candidatus Heimdallarchaeota archaeon]